MRVSSHICWGARNHKVIKHFDHVVLQGLLGKRKLFCFHYQSDFDHQTVQDGKLP